MKQKNRIGWAVTLLCVMLCTMAAADIQIRMEPVEWTWEAGGTATFSGVIQNDGADISGAVLQLKVESQAEESGEAVFSNLNGKSIKVRKRSAEMDTDLTGGNAENTFEGEWYIPAEIEEELSSVTVRLIILDADGKELGHNEMKVGEQEAGMDAPATVSIVKRVEQLILYLLISSAAVWIAAVSRHIILNRKRA